MCRHEWSALLVPELLKSFPLFIIMQCETYNVLLLANLKKAVTISMTEQSRQQIINKRLQLSLQIQQKLLIASTQETQKVVQYQAAKLTQQDIHLRVSAFICL